MGRRKITERLTTLDKKDEFDREFWRKAGHEARFAAAWEMVVEVELIRGKNAAEPRLQRDVLRIKRRGS